jgi:hypothetical protein
MDKDIDCGGALSLYLDAFPKLGLRELRLKPVGVSTLFRPANTYLGRLPSYLKSW